MIEIQENLFVGNEDDYEGTARWEHGWKVVHACRDPYHRKAHGIHGPRHDAKGSSGVPDCSPR